MYVIILHVEAAMENHNKKEKTYWGVKESLLDKSLTDKIEKYAQKIRILTLYCLLSCCLMQAILLIQRLFNKTVAFIISTIILAAELSLLAAIIVFAVRLFKLKKQVQKTQESTKSQSSKNNVM